MSISSAVADLPVLCIDTCSLLDIMRDPTRDTARPLDRQAAIDLVTIAEANALSCLMAEQVNTEFVAHDKSVQDEADNNLQNIRRQLERMNQISAVLGSPGVVDLTHFDDHVARTRAVVERWLARLEIVRPSISVPAKAFARVNAGLAPAKRGKESSKDCLVYETYLEVAAELRRVGLVKPIVFLSSNTQEYLAENRTLKSDIARDFNPLNIIYASNMNAAKHFLGF